MPSRSVRKTSRSDWATTLCSCKVAANKPFLSPKKCRIRPASTPASFAMAPCLRYRLRAAATQGLEVPLRRRRDGSIRPDPPPQPRRDHPTAVPDHGRAHHPLRVTQTHHHLSRKTHHALPAAHQMAGRDRARRRRFDRRRPRRPSVPVADKDLRNSRPSHQHRRARRANVDPRKDTRPAFPRRRGLRRRG